MRTRKLSILFATAFAMVHGKADANTGPSTSAVTSYQEVDNSTIFYGVNKIYPTSIKMEIINRYMDEFANNPDTYIRVTSHTDDSGDWETNLNISKKRALIMADHLHDFGIPKDRIIVDWLGEDAPMYFSAKERHKNRRTHIRIIRKVRQARTNAVASHSQKSSRYEVVETEVRQASESKPQASQPIVVRKPQSIAKKPIIRKEKAPETVVTRTRVIKKEVPTEAPVAMRRVMKKPTTSIVTKTNEEEFTAKSAASLPQKTILFVDAISKEPVQVEVDLNTSRGRTSVSTSEKGELKVDMNDLKRNSLDVYAYGYFFKSKIIETGSGTQIIELTPTDSGNKVELNELQFVPGKSILLSESNAELERLYLSLMMNPDQKVEIGGHINVPGKTLEELTPRQRQLSTDRAKAVFDFLVKKGISKKRLAYKGYGNSQMLFPEPLNDEEKARNRRVEVKIIK